MLYLDDVSLPGHGEISGVFRSRDHQILAVASVFRPLTEPPARAAYAGRKLRYRVSLYRPPSRRPIAVFDRSAFPINDVGFHPTRPLVVLGAGSYDGGYMFEGHLTLWDWVSGQSQSLRAIPEIVRVRFTEDGNDIEAIVRPWDEGFGEGRIEKPFETFYRISIAEALARPWNASIEQAVHDQIESQKPLSGHEVAALPFFQWPSVDPCDEIKSALGLDRFHHRSPIWDVTLIGSDSVAMAHDGCWLEVFGRQGDRRHSLQGRGYGVQIFRADMPLIHVVDRNDWLTDCNTMLLKLHGCEASEIISLTGRYTFSVAQDGSVLGRRDRSYQEEGAGDEADVILGSDLTKATMCDLGHYDVFNHYIRIDRAPYLFFVQGTPPNSHENKYLCTVTKDGRIKRLWPLLMDAGDEASHAMECCFCFIQDGRGPGVIVSGRRFNSIRTDPCEGFIYRKNLEGHELWRHATSASAAAIKVAPGSDLVMAAFLDGTFAMIRGENGAVAHWEPFTPDGNASVIFSLDVDETHVAFGTIDGRCGVTPLAQFVDAPFA
jgi:hypothetical protein